MESLEMNTPGGRPAQTIVMVLVWSPDQQLWSLDGGTHIKFSQTTGPIV